MVAKSEKIRTRDLESALNIETPAPALNRDPVRDSMDFQAAKNGPTFSEAYGKVPAIKKKMTDKGKV